MDPKFQATFIPHRPMMPGGAAERKNSSNVTILGIISGIVLVVMGGLSLLVFFYKDALINSNNEKKEKISQEIAAIDPMLTEDLTTLKARIDAATELFRSHIALSTLFSVLQQSTLASIQYQTLDYTQEDNIGFSVKLKGIAGGFNDVAYQSDVLSQNTYLKESKISNFILTDEGNVEFLVEAMIDPDQVTFAKALETAATEIPPQVVENIPAQASTTEESVLNQNPTQ
jgi:hypothetical protein